MPPGVRKLALVAHVICSVGWLGTVVAFLMLAIAGLRTDDVEQARSAYLAMKLVAWFAIVPACVAAFVTGLVQSLGTSWGVIRHYWVIAKLVLTIVASALLMLHMQVVDMAAQLATTVSSQDADFDAVRTQLVFDASAAVAVLVVTTALSVFKPRGLTSYGRRKQLAG
jgi:uncharacterized membrane protein